MKYLILGSVLLQAVIGKEVECNFDHPFSTVNNTKLLYQQCALHSVPEKGGAKNLVISGPQSDIRQVIIPNTILSLVDAPFLTKPSKTPFLTVPDFVHFPREKKRYHTTTNYFSNKNKGQLTLCTPLGCRILDSLDFNYTQPCLLESTQDLPCQCKSPIPVDYHPTLPYILAVCPSTTSTPTFSSHILYLTLSPLNSITSTHHREYDLPLTFYPPHDLPPKIINPLDPQSSITLPSDKFSSYFHVEYEKSSSILPDHELFLYNLSPFIVPEAPFFALSHNLFSMEQLDSLSNAVRTERNLYLLKDSSPNGPLVFSKAVEAVWGEEPQEGEKEKEKQGVKGGRIVLQSLYSKLEPIITLHDQDTLRYGQLDGVTETISQEAYFYTGLPELVTSFSRTENRARSKKYEEELIAELNARRAEGAMISDEEWRSLTVDLSSPVDHYYAAKLHLRLREEIDKAVQDGLESKGEEEINTILDGIYKKIGEEVSNSVWYMFIGKKEELKDKDAKEVMGQEKGEEETEKEKKRKSDMAVYCQRDERRGRGLLSTTYDKCVSDWKSKSVLYNWHSMIKNKENVKDIELKQKMFKAINGPQEERRESDRKEREEWVRKFWLVVKYGSIVLLSVSGVAVVVIVVLRYIRRRKENALLEGQKKEEEV